MWTTNQLVEAGPSLEHYWGAGGEGCLVSSSQATTGEMIYLPGRRAVELVAMEGIEGFFRWRCTRAKAFV